MRSFLRWVVCLFAGALTLLGQPVTESAANVSCFERIIVPDYPAFARQLRLAAEVTVSIVIGRGSASHQITTQVEKLPTRLAGTKAGDDIGRLFSERVEKAVRSSTFSDQCVGKTVGLVFSFELGNDMPVEGSKQTISFSYPNRFTIASTAVLVNP